MDLQNARISALNSTVEGIGSFVFSHFHQKKLTFDTKKDGSIVTEVDREAEMRARSALLDRFPDDGFLGEEYGEIKGTSGYRWVVDPIDGTASFARGVPLFGTLIGLESNGKVLAGAANLPAIGETIAAVVGEGVTYQYPSRVSSVENLNDAMICTTSFDYYKETGSEQLYESLLTHAGSIRGWSDCFAYLLLCTGRVDAVVEPLLFPWDIIPWLPIIQESGGKFSPIASGGIASNHNLHASLYDALHENITC
ncbi:MAG: inositol monophosphatase family protein [Phycisphaerales bacterium]|jgi:myo-inositol-1(or 4)-monophosphatase|nr:inositol monophosphatase family protein [Phycisphaerales bacterium]